MYRFGRALANFSRRMSDFFNQSSGATRRDRRAAVSAKGARRWQQGHPWIYRSDVTQRPSAAAGVVRVRDARGKAIGLALWSPRSEISLRLLDANPSARIDAAWWSE